MYFTEMKPRLTVQFDRPPADVSDTVSLLHGSGLCIEQAV